MDGNRRHAVVLIVLLIYWGISLEYLSVFPPVGEDEPWIAAVPYKLATQGIYGSDLFAGYYGVDRHNFQHPPVYPLLEAGVFELAGVGVFQMRFLPVALGLLVLPLAFAVGRQVRDRRAGAAAMVLLIGQRLAGGGSETGIPLLDIARVNRYDIAVPVFGLAGFWLFNIAEQRHDWRWYVASGAVIGISGLCHVYGAFWLAALLLVLLSRRPRGALRQVEPGLLLAGFALVWLPWIAYAVANWTDYVGQMRFLASRFDVLSPRFYINNVVHEVDRYRGLDLLDGAGRLRVTRPGTWTAIIGLTIGVGTALWRRRLAVTDRPFALLVLLVVQAAMFAALLEVKDYNYAIAIWPVAVLTLAWVGVELWESTHRWLIRGALIVLLLLVMLEGGSRIARRRIVAAGTTPYVEFENRVASYIPPGARVLGLQHYWLGLRQYPYRTWLLPVLYADPLYYHASLTLDQAMERVGPDVILIDRYMRGYFASLADPAHPRHAQYLEFERYMTGHGATLAGVVDDQTYGKMEIYRLGDAPHAEEDR